MSVQRPVYVGRRRSAGRAYGVSLTLSCLAAACHVLPRAVDLFQYDRFAIVGGEVWRIVTCQWTHWNLSHLAWDGVMFLALGVMCERVSRARYVACVGTAAVVIPLMVALAAPSIRYFRGLSGIDSALFVLFCLQLIRLHNRSDLVTSSVAAAALTLFLIKTIYECVTGNILFVQPEGTFTPVPLSHIVGGAIGVMTASMGGSHVHTRYLSAGQYETAGSGGCDCDPWCSAGTEFPTGRDTKDSFL